MTPETHPINSVIICEIVDSTNNNCEVVAPGLPPLPALPWYPSGASDSNGEISNDLPGEPISQTMVIEKSQDIRVRPCDFAGS